VVLEEMVAMTVDELRRVLNALPKKWDDVEVMIQKYPGLCHVDTLELERRRYVAPQWADVAEDRRGRKLRLIARRRRLWYQPPPDWTLEGPWPEGLDLVGLEHLEVPK
jgi:hypothetical protein